MMSFIIMTLAVIGLLNVIGLAVFLLIVLIERNNDVRSNGKKRFGANRVRTREVWRADD
jgi:hypothetical protein